MLKRALIALVTGLTLTLALSAIAFAWQSRIEGRPVSFEAGSSPGVYFWHEDAGMRLRTTDPENVEHIYRGVLTSDGTFAALDLVKAERDDMASIDASGHKLSFSFHTYSGIDGMDFQIDGGTQLTLSLYRDDYDAAGKKLSSQRLPIDNIYLGAYSVHPDRNPFTVRR